MFILIEIEHLKTLPILFDGPRKFIETPTFSAQKATIESTCKNLSTKIVGDIKVGGQEGKKLCTCLIAGC